MLIMIMACNGIILARMGSIAGLATHLNLGKKMDITHFQLMGEQALVGLWFSNEAADIISCGRSRKYSSQSLIIYIICGDKTNFNFHVYFSNFFIQSESIHLWHYYIND